MLTVGTVVLTVITGKSSVAVEAETILDGVIYSASGTSKCDPVDSFDYEIGLQLATGRAIRQLGRDIYKAGNDRVKQNDRIRAKQKAEQEKLLKIKQTKARLARKEYLATQKKASGKTVGKTLAKLSAKR